MKQKIKTIALTLLAIVTCWGGHIYAQPPTKSTTTPPTVGTRYIASTAYIASTCATPASAFKIQHSPFKITSVRGGSQSYDRGQDLTVGTHAHPAEISNLQLTPQGDYDRYNGSENCTVKKCGRLLIHGHISSYVRHNGAAIGIQSLGRIHGGDGLGWQPYLSKGDQFKRHNLPIPQLRKLATLDESDSHTIDIAGKEECVYA